MMINCVQYVKLASMLQQPGAQFNLSVSLKVCKIPCNRFNGSCGTIGDRGIDQREFQKDALFWDNELNHSCVTFPATVFLCFFFF